MPARNTVMTLGFLLAAGSAASAHAQAPWDRRIEAVGITPGSAPGAPHSIRVFWGVSIMPASTPLNLDFQVTLIVNGVPRWTSPPIGFDVEAGSGLCGFGNPCSGGCGTGYINGITAAAFLCLDCECRTPPLAFDVPPQPLQPGDEITVILMPAPGAFPEFDQSGNTRHLVFRGEPISWDRRIQSVQAQPSAGMPDSFFDVFVGVAASANYDGQLDLGASLDLVVNGTVVDSTPADGFDDILGWTQCANLPCNDTVACVMDLDGNFLGTCQPDEGGPWDCGCQYHPVPGPQQPRFVAVPIDPVVEVFVILRPAPGSLPELPGFEDDGEAVPLPCPADLTGDGQVDVQDLVALLLSWGGPGPGDLNEDGIVDVQDLVALLIAWGNCVPV